MTLLRGYKLISHLEDEYKTWYNELEDKTDVRNWKEFVEFSVKSCNENNGTEEDFVFIAEDAMENVSYLAPPVRFKTGKLKLKKMKHTKHTDGEWKVSEFLNMVYVNTTPTVQFEICSMNKHALKEVNTANAKLIATSPILLENLIRIIDRIEEAELQYSFPSAYSRAKEAIKQATT